MTIPITNPSDGSEVGFIRITVYESPEAIGQRFGTHMSRTPFPVDYPLGVLEEIEVLEKDRNRRFGSAGLILADAYFVRLGVKTAILKVGWSPEENWESAKERRVRFYERAGWKTFAWVFPQPVLMAKDYRTEVEMLRK